MDDKEKGNLAIGKAHEPQENAYQPSTQNMPPSENKEKKQSIAFTDNEIADSQTSNTYKVGLSQPAAGLSHLQKLLWLQNKRTRGLWAQCDECDRWRYLPNTLDRHELPKKWFCWMNPDTSLAKCSEDETPIRLHEEEDLIHNEYAAGSLVVARLPGWPWWPAMVDDCPDTEQFYWLDGFSDIPTHYNVAFFDRSEVTRAWVDPTRLKPYGEHKGILKTSLQNKTYRKRLEVAASQADDAESLSLADRLRKYSFVGRYPGPILKPKKITRKYHQRYRRRFERKYNIELTSEGSDSDCEDTDDETEAKAQRSNVITPGSEKTGRNGQHDAKNKPDGLIDSGASPAAPADTVKEDLTNDTSSAVPAADDPSDTRRDARELESIPPSPTSGDFDFNYH